MPWPLPAVPAHTGPPESTRPLLVYVNVPFCNSKCHFCDWVVRVPVKDLRLAAEAPGRSQHLAAIVTQIRAQAPALRAGGYRPVIMYWGGGTASILTEAEIEAIHACLAQEFDLSGVVEATIEGSPESITPAKLNLLRRLGFNRISIGVQAFDDLRLRHIGRSHSAERAVEAVHAAHDAGFGNANIDLIVGFPEQPLAEVEQTVRTALSLPVNHFSVYPYRASLGTVMRKQINRETTHLNLTQQLEAYDLTTAMLADAGYPEYAMSYFGNPRCASDEAYYQLHMDWIGFGSGANSLIGQRFLANDRGQLQRYNANPTEFDVDSPASAEPLTMHFMSQALTTAEGMDARLFEQRTGVSLPAACESPGVAGYLAHMGRFGTVIRDEDGVRLRREDISRVYVSLNWVEPAAPVMAS